MGHAAGSEGRLRIRVIGLPLYNKRLFLRLTSFSPSFRIQDGWTFFYLYGFSLVSIIIGKWVKATPAFNKTLCAKYHVDPLEFNGQEDSIFQAYTADEKLFMEYTEYYGTFSSVPIKTMIKTWQDVYGCERVEKWFQHLGNYNNSTRRDFYKETPFVP